LAEEVEWLKESLAKKKSSAPPPQRDEKRTRKRARMSHISDSSDKERYPSFLVNEKDPSPPTLIGGDEEMMARPTVPPTRGPHSYGSFDRKGFSSHRGPPSGGGSGD